MSKLFKQILILVSLIALLTLPYFVFAAESEPAASASPPPDMKGMLEGTGGYGGYSVDTNQLTMSQIIGTIVRAFLSLLGIIFVVLIIFAGFNWMTASGDEEKLKKAKDTIRTSIIGLVIVVGAYAIWIFLFLRIIYGS